MLENRATILITLALLLYFMWMDVALFHLVHSRRPEVVPDSLATPRDTTTAAATVTDSSIMNMVSPFTGLSVKMMMMDQVNNYIHTPIAHIFNEATHFSTVFYFITPNMVSFIGFLFAVGAARAIAVDSRAFHYLAVVLFQIRTWMDALDGIVARSRIGIVQHVSLRNTNGYVVDGAADAFGFTAFLIGCFYYLCHSVSKHKTYLPLSSSEKEAKTCNGVSHNAAPSSFSNRRILCPVVCFGLQMALSAFFWDHYINTYHTLLESQPSTQVQANSQSEILRSSITWVLMWFWRISNAHTLMQMLLYAVCLNKMFEFLVWIQYIGFAHILSLSLLTEIHVTTMKNLLIQSGQ